MLLSSSIFDYIYLAPLELVSVWNSINITSNGQVEFWNGNRSLGSRNVDSASVSQLIVGSQSFELGQVLSLLDQFGSLGNQSTGLSTRSRGDQDVEQRSTIVGSNLGADRGSCRSWQRCLDVCSKNREGGNVADWDTNSSRGWTGLSDSGVLANNRGLLGDRSLTGRKLGESGLSNKLVQVGLDHIGTDDLDVSLQKHGFGVLGNVLGGV
ncbi:hypothetical protein OGAPHI_003465 [Ogataea philodendri]|uniref:Uncharacterized protein n=1 Tax=Ogataea philodendri TaxID=1378263 RepID=A0A9P8T5M1_9ASCO|nr:uncharacterized protein OGAPHI_003465 [Ogataea philodendri]KAH3666469.1 hypothetical protein OGAPHI_003465 [Ogataea philodendri]